MRALARTLEISYAVWPQLRTFSGSTRVSVICEMKQQPWFFLRSVLIKRLETVPSVCLEQRRRVSAVADGLIG